MQTKKNYWGVTPPIPPPNPFPFWLHLWHKIRQSFCLFVRVFVGQAHCTRRTSVCRKFWILKVELKQGRIQGIEKGRHTAKMGVHCQQGGFMHHNPPPPPESRHCRYSFKYNVIQKPRVYHLDSIIFSFKLQTKCNITLIWLLILQRLGYGPHP